MDVILQTPMKTLGIISFFAFSQVVAFAQDAAEGLLAQILPAGNYQLISSPVKTDIANEDLRHQVVDVKVRYEKGEAILDFGDQSVPIYYQSFDGKSIYSITFTIPPSKDPGTWFVTRVFLGKPSSAYVAGKIVGEAWFITYSSIGIGVEQKFSLEQKKN